MSLLHHTLEPRLAVVVARAGFVATDDGRSGAPDVEVAHLGYRLDLAERRVLLDFCQVAARRTVSAVLWSPGDLARAGADAGAEAVALRQRTWRYDASSHWDALADDIVAEVGAWLEQGPWARATS